MFKCKAPQQNKLEYKLQRLQNTLVLNWNAHTLDLKNEKQHRTLYDFTSGRYFHNFIKAAKIVNGQKIWCDTVITRGSEPTWHEAITIAMLHVVLKLGQGNLVMCIYGSRKLPYSLAHISSDGVTRVSHSTHDFGNSTSVMTFLQNDSSHNKWLETRVDSFLQNLETSCWKTQFQHKEICCFYFNDACWILTQIFSCDCIS